MSYLAARHLDDAACAIQGRVWQRVLEVSGYSDRRPIRAWLIDLCRNENSHGPPPFQERQVRLTAALAELDRDSRELLRFRLADRSFAAIAEHTGRRIERLERQYQGAVAQLQGAIPGLRIATVPEDRGEIAAWIERHLVGARLGELAAELSAVHALTAVQPAALAPLLRNGRRRAVLERGLCELSPRRLSELMTHPRLLLQVQEIVLPWGGTNWDAVRPIDDRLDVLTRQSWRRLSRAA